MIKIGQMVLKGVILVSTMIKLCQMVLKGVNWVHNDKIRFKWSGKESVLGSQ